MLKKCWKIKIATFDKEFVHTGRIDKCYSRIMHRTFAVRQEGDYREFVELSFEEAEEFVILAREFIETLTEIIKINN